LTVDADEIKARNDQLFKSLASGPSRGAADAVSAWTRRQIRGETRRGAPKRSLFHRIMPPIPVHQGQPTPDWETGAWLGEIVESLELAAEREARMSAHELWRMLHHEARLVRWREWRRVWWAMNRGNGDNRPPRVPPGFRIPAGYTSHYDKYRFGMRVATRLLSQIRELEAR
jgi:hypothetical protein